MTEKSELEKELEQNNHFHFDGAGIYFVDVEGNIIETFYAVSGKRGTSATDQDKSWEGPLPEGIYVLNSQEIRYAPPEGFSGLFGDWGEAHAPIHSVGGVMYGRDGFHVHGGLVRGSAGCIDLGPDVIRFFDLFVSSGQERVLIVVHYEHPAAFRWGDEIDMAWRPAGGLPGWMLEQSKYLAFHSRAGEHRMHYQVKVGDEFRPIDE